MRFDPMLGGREVQVGSRRVRVFEMRVRFAVRAIARHTRQELSFPLWGRSTRRGEGPRRPLTDARERRPWT